MRHDRKIVAWKPTGVMATQGGRDLTGERAVWKVAVMITNFGCFRSASRGASIDESSWFGGTSTQRVTSETEMRLRECMAISKDIQKKLVMVGNYQEIHWKIRIEHWIPRPSLF